jgi:hypothetical protein
MPTGYVLPVLGRPLLTHMDTFLRSGGVETSSIGRANLEVYLSGKGVYSRYGVCLNGLEKAMALSTGIPSAIS